MPTPAEKFIDSTLRDSLPAVSVITEIELLCWKTANNQDLSILKKFITDIHVFELDKSIKLQTVKIRKTYNIKLPDAIIAATAFANDVILLTRNIKDFKKVRKLKVINPFEI